MLIIASRKHYSVDIIIAWWVYGIHSLIPRITGGHSAVHASTHTDHVTLESLWVFFPSVAFVGVFQPILMHLSLLCVSCLVLTRYTVPLVDFFAERRLGFLGTSCVDLLSSFLWALCEGLETVELQLLVLNQCSRCLPPQVAIRGILFSRPLHSLFQSRLCYGTTCS